MRPVSRLLFGAAAVMMLGGAALAANRAHMLNVAMPDGSVAHIRYVGDTPPRVVVVPSAPAMALPVAMFEGGPSFALLDRMVAEMDARADAMVRQAAALARVAPAAAGRVDPAARAVIPPGTMSYSMVSFSSGRGGTCSRSVQVTALRPGEAPKVVQQSSGDCTAMSRAPAPAAERAVKPGAPAIVPARYIPTAPASKTDPTA